MSTTYSSSTSNCVQISNGNPIPNTMTTSGTSGIIPGSPIWAGTKQVGVAMSSTTGNSMYVPIKIYSNFVEVYGYHDMEDKGLYYKRKKE